MGETKDKNVDSNKKEETVDAAKESIDAEMENVDNSNAEGKSGSAANASAGATQKNTIPTSTTGEDDIPADSGSGDAMDSSNAKGSDGGYKGSGRGYTKRGGYGKGGGRSGNYRGRNQRRHAPYHTRNNNSKNSQNNGNDDNDNDANMDDEERGRRVYVGNLSWDVSWADLKDHMKSTGYDVTRADVMTNHDGRSKGCGIVEFASAEGARNAVLTLNDTELMGRQIFVREDREGKGSGQAVSGGDGKVSNSGGSTSGAVNAQSRRCYVGNLSWDVAWQDLKDHMRTEGDVVFAEVMTDPDGRSKGCGIVEYATAEEAHNAIVNLTDTELNGRMIFVREDRETASGGNVSGSGTSGGNTRHSASVYVGNLAFETSWQDLKDHMRGAGNVDQANILTNEDGRSKGCAIVLYQRPQDAQRAIRELHNSELHGRPILVREDREQGGGGFRHQSRGYSGGSSGAGGTQLFVGNLSFDTSWKELKDHFRQCGDVERAEVMEGPDGRRKGFGTVKFYRQKDANNAIRRLHGTELQGRRLEVRLDQKAN